MNNPVGKGMIRRLYGRINAAQQGEVENVFDVIEKRSAKGQEKQDVIQTADRLLLSTSPTVRESKHDGINEREEEIEPDQVVILVNLGSARIVDAPIRNDLLEVCRAPCELQSKRGLAGRLIGTSNARVEETEKHQEQRQRCNRKRSSVTEAINPIQGPGFVAFCHDVCSLTEFRVSRSRSLA